MNEIKDLLATCGVDGYVTPEELQVLAQAFALLVAKVEELESKITILEGGN
jgi:hypothetical protein